MHLIFGNLMLILVEMIRKHGGGEHIKQQPVFVCLSVRFVFAQNLKSILHCTCILWHVFANIFWCFCQHRQKYRITQSLSVVV